VKSVAFKLSGIMLNTVQMRISLVSAEVLCESHKTRPSAQRLASLLLSTTLHLFVIYCN